jgi:hypothetical protein
MAEPPEDGLDRLEPEERERREERDPDREPSGWEKLAEAIRSPSWKLVLAVAFTPAALVLTLVGLLWGSMDGRVTRIEQSITTFTPQLYDKHLYDDIGNLEVHVEALNESGQGYSQELERLLCKAAGFEIQLGTGECEHPDYILRVHLFTDVDPYERSR